MKCIVFDSGPLISLALNSMLDIIQKLKTKYKGSFYITSAVRREIIEIPMKSKRFGFEALQMKRLLNKNHLEMFDTGVYSEETDIITGLANNIFFINEKNLNILNKGELECLMLAKNLNAEALVVDERTTRLLLENPYRLHKYLEKKFHAKIRINKENLKEFERHFSTLKIIRSVELALVAVDKGFFNDFLLLDKKFKVVEAILWALKLNGCAVSEKEIKKYVKMYRIEE